MKDQAVKRHPGPFRIRQLDSEFAGILVALGFVILAVIGMPSIGTGFLLVALAVGLWLRLCCTSPKRVSKYAQAHAL